MCDNIVQIDNYKHEMVNFDFTIDTKMKLLKLGHTYAKKFIKDQPREICVAIINIYIDMFSISAFNLFFIKAKLICISIKKKYY